MARDLEGKVFLVTGGTDGIGLAACREFARRGARLVLVARGPQKAAAVASELKAAGAGATEVIPGDLGSLADVRRVARDFKASHDRLDVLVANAGAVFRDYRQSVDGYELTFAVNHLSHFLLTNLLVGVLARTPGARVVTTSSGAHRMGRMDLATVAKRDGSAGFAAYGDAKLANILFTRELARRQRDNGIVANCLHPGWVASRFGLNNAGPVAVFIQTMAPLLARTPEKGARTLVWLAASPEAGQRTGGYFMDCKPAALSSRARSDELATRLWTLSEKLCGIA